MSDEVKTLDELLADPETRKWLVQVIANGITFTVDLRFYPERMFPCSR